MLELSVRQAPCPYCGQDVLDQEGPGACAHLLADWTVDPGDNGGGLLGGALAGGSLPVRPLALAIQSLQAELLDEITDRYEQKLKPLSTILPPAQEPSWWPTLCAALDDQDNVAIKASTYDLGRIPTLLASELLWLPEVSHSSICLTSRPLMSIDIELLWAQDPSLATTAITRCFADATKAVSSATVLLKELNSPALKELSTEKEAIKPGTKSIPRQGSEL